MTREDYVQLLIKNGYPETFTKINFPRLLMHVASDLFVKEEHSILVDETRRRLIQLKKLGYTDE